MSLGAIMQPAVDLVASILPTIPGSNVRAGTYTAAGGSPVTANGAVFIREQPKGGVQRKAATILLLQAEIADEPTDGATFAQDGTTWTGRTWVRGAATWRGEAWA